MWLLGNSQVSVAWPAGVVAIGGYASVSNLAYKTTSIIPTLCKYKAICIALTEFERFDHIFRK
jgi:hypothetical protein